MNAETTTITGLTLAVFISVAGIACAQERSLSVKVNEDIGKNPTRAISRFESPKRDVVKGIEQILEACELKPGMQIADVGAGSGLHARLFAGKVLPGGKVYAVEIFQDFLNHIEATCQTQRIDNVVCVLGTTTSSMLQPASVDVVFTCNTYHHFEYPFKMLASIRDALRPGGRLIIIDDKKKTKHVRADKASVIREVEQAGFKLVDETDFSERNFLARFEKR